MSIAPSPLPETSAATSDGESTLESTPQSPEKIDVSDAETFKSTSSPRFGKWRPFLSCGGALGLGLWLAHALVKPAPRASVEGASASAAQVYLARSATLVVSAQKPPGALLRGKISLVADLTGRAPVAGAVARQLVEPGTRVKRGDAVMEISSGEAERPAPRVESLQNEAEQSQIQAADAQTALAGKVGAAQAQLQSARERVAAAQAQIGVARDLVRRLQNGESVARSELPAPFRAKSDAVSEAAAPSDSPRPRRRRRLARSSRTAPNVAKTTVSPLENRAAEIALQQAQAAADAAREGLRDLQTARQMLLSAQNSGRESDEKLKSAATAVDLAEKNFEAKKATGADVEAARSAQRDAQATASAAAKGLAGAKIELAKREKSAASLQSYADKAQAEAAQLSAASKTTGAIQNPPASAPKTAGDSPAVASDEAAPPVAADAGGSADAGRVTLAEAARFAGAAVAESRSASRDAERIHAQIETYQGQVTSSRTRIESATQNLASAQQKVLDSVPRPRFTSSRAPADGIVTWVSRLAREVGSGQSIFGLASGHKIGVRFEDKSGLWRGLKTGETLPAMVVVAPVAAENSPPKPSATPIDTASPNAASPNANNSSIAATGAANGPTVSVQVTAIAPPETAGQAAQVTGDLRVGDSGGNGNAPPLRAGMDVLISVAQPNAKPTLSVPVSAVVRRGSVDYLAVLTPISTSASPTASPTASSTASSTTSPTASSTASSTTSPTASSTTSPSDREAKIETTGFYLKWQAVETGRTDGLRQEIRVGLEAGARVVVLPSELEAMGFSAPESQVKDANSAIGVAASLSPSIEIRLTES